MLVGEKRFDEVNNAYEQVLDKPCERFSALHGEEVFELIQYHPFWSQPINQKETEF